MIELFNYWVSSAKLLAPSELLRIIRSGAYSFGISLRTLLISFGWFILADLLIFVMFGRPLLQFYNGTEEVARNVQPALLALHLISSLVWFMINTIVLLLLRWEPKDESALSYVRRGFPRYVQLCIAFLSMALVVAVLLLSLGVRKMPPANWPLILAFKAMELCVLFFWLDSDGSINGFLRSAERGLNFIVYNLPTIAFFMTMLWLTDFMLTSLFIGGEFSFNSGALLLNSKVESLMFDQTSWVAPFQFLAFRYSKTLSQYFWLSCIVVLYKRFGKIKYAESLFKK